MSRERKTKLAQSRRRANDDDSDVDNPESGPALIDDSGSENEDEDVLQLSHSDDDEDEDDDALPAPRHPRAHDAEDQPKAGKVREPSKGSTSPPTSESYDRLEDDTLRGSDFVDLGASNVSVGRVTDTSVMLNGFKDITAADAEGDEAGTQQVIQFDELDDSISFEPRAPAHKSPPSARQPSSSPVRGRGFPPRGRGESYWQRRNRDKEEYKKRLEDPTFTPYVGEFFMHDSRGKRQFDSLNQFPGGPRGRGRARGARGAGAVHREEREVRNHVPEEPVWGHDGFEEFEPPKPQPVAAKPRPPKPRSQPSSVGRQTPQQNPPTEQSSKQQSPIDPKPQLQPKSIDPQPTRRPTNVEELTSSIFTITISLPNIPKQIAKQVKLTSYVGRVPYQKALRGDRPVRITSIPGAGNREIYPTKERSWLPYFLKNAAAMQASRDGVRSRGGSIASTGEKARVATPTRIPPSAVYASSFTPQSEEEDKPTKIKVNLPAVTTTGSSASPAVSDSSSLHVHHPRPTKHINIADIDDSSARLKAFLNPQTSSSPSHSHERTGSTQLPETAVHAAPFQPSQFVSPQQQQTIPPFNAAMPYFYPPYNPMAPDFSGPGPSSQSTFFPPQSAPSRFESNGMVYYYTEPPMYCPPFQPPPANTTTQQSNQSSSSGGPPQQEEATDSSRQPYYYYHPGQMAGMSDAQRAAQMGMFYPPYSGS